MKNHLLKGITRLSIINLEEKLMNYNIHKISGQSIFIDLSQCRFANLDAMFKLLMLVEGILKTDSTVYFALPTIRYTFKELQNKKMDVGLKKNLLISRKQTNSFFKVSGFVTALQDVFKEYNNEVYITENYDFGTEFNLQSFQDSFSVIFDEYHLNDFNYRYIFPFRWIDCSRGIENFKKIEDDLIRILENEERGLNHIDVKAIKNVLLSELVKNVNEHSGTKLALLVIGLINVKSLKSENINPLEKGYIGWVKESGFLSQVEIYFGDSGSGILTEEYKKEYSEDENGKTNTPERQLELAFQKWTTLKGNRYRTETKGLYRMQRIINKYNGIIHIDTGRLNGGFRKGGFTDEDWCFRDKPSTFQGTTINIKLNPYKELNRFKYKFKGSSKEKKWISKRYVVNEQLTCAEDINNEVRNSDNFLIILDLKHLSDEIAKQVLEDLFPKISYASYPCAIVIYLISNLKNDTIETITDSVNTYIIQKSNNEVFPETQNENAEEIYDPVLVIGSDNKVSWYGGNQDLINILKESQVSEERKKLSELDSFVNISEKTKRDEIKLRLYTQEKLITINNNEEIILNFQGIGNLYKKIISDNSKTKLNENYCTPKLQVIDKWMDVAKMLKENEYGFALNLYLQYIDYLGDIDKLDTNNTFILIDHKQQKQLARAFASLLGVKHRNIRNTYTDIDTNTPRRTKLFPRNSMVIILTTIISSSETIRRLVKYSKRDYTKTDVILCLGNFRKHNITKLRTWSDTTEIISCYQVNSKEETKPIRNDAFFIDKLGSFQKSLKYMGPDFKQEEKAEITIIEPQLKKFLKENKFLHYNHIGVYNGRHFTFYLNKQKILNIKSFIWDKLNTTIFNWTEEKSISQYRIYIPKKIISFNSPFLSFLKTLGNKIEVFEEIPTSINEPNVVFFDFGILTGSTLREFIKSCTNVDNILVCILFDQSTSNSIYSRIDKLNDKNNFINDKKLTDFSFKYLFSFPLNYFSSQDCPICEHIRALDYYKVKNEYMFRFSENRQELLKLVNNDEVNEREYPADFNNPHKKDVMNKSGIDPLYELSSEIIMSMYEYKILFENAKRFTSQRVVLYKEIVKLYFSLNDLISNCESKLYAFLYYLSYEINWLQRDPLTFRDLRFLISKISLRVAVYNRSELEVLFKKSNTSKNKPRRLVSRYKYAAISVLRSSDKLLFCKKIQEIIESGVSDNGVSDSILQNTLYHISSLHINSYNKSPDYFRKINENLKNIIDSNIYLSIDQKLAIDRMYLTNRLLLNSANYDFEETTEAILFKEMKAKWKGLYYSIPNHPAPFNHFNALYLERHYEIIKNYRKEGNSDNKSILEDIINDLESEWRIVRQYIENDIYYYLNRLRYITDSTFYSSRFSNVLNHYQYQKDSERFTELIYEIKNNPQQYISHQLEYNGLYSYFENCFIKKKGLQEQKDNSLILDLLSEFPSNLKKIIDEVFPPNKFIKRTFNNFNDDYQIFFPKKVLKGKLKLVVENIQLRLIDGLTYRDMNIDFSITEEKRNIIELVIKYDSTTNKKGQKFKGGSLYGWKKEIEEFGGGLSYKIPTTDDTNFYLNLKFMKYA